MVWQGILGNINIDNNSGSNLGGAPAEKPAEGANGPAKEEKNDWLEILDPEQRVIVLGITFERAQEEDLEAFRKRWKTYLGNVCAAVDPGLPDDFDSLSPWEKRAAEGRRQNNIAYELQMAKIGNQLFEEARVPQSKKEKEEALKRLQTPLAAERKSVIFRWDQGVMTREEVSGEGTKSGSRLESVVAPQALQDAPQKTISTRDSELERRVADLSAQVEALSRSLEEQRNSPQLSAPSSEASTPDYAAMLEKLRSLEEQLKRIEAGIPSAFPAAYTPAAQATPVAAIDYKTLGDAIGEGVGGKIGAALKQTLETIAVLLAKFAATPRAPAQPATYIAQPLPSPQYEAPSGSSAADAAQSSPAASGAESGGAAPAPNYWAMDYKEVRRAAGTSLDAAEKMLMDSAINNCSSPQGEQALQRLISRKPAQAEAFRAYVQRHRERIGIAKPKGTK